MGKRTRESGPSQRGYERAIAARMALAGLQLGDVAWELGISRQAFSKRISRLGHEATRQHSLMTISEALDWNLADLRRWAFEADEILAAQSRRR